MAKLRKLFLDIEVSPNLVYSWGVGNKINVSYESIVRERTIICLAYRFEGDKQTKTLIWDHWDDETLVKQLIPILEKADEVIGHFIDGFDWPWIRSRAIKHNVELPLVKTVDTIKLARTFYFNSNKLDYLSRFLLNDRKVKTDYQLWIDVCDGNKSALKRMVDYCKKDVELLERVYQKLQRYVPLATHAAVVMGGLRSDCPQCGSANVQRRGYRITATGMKKQIMSCNDCGRNYTVAHSVAVREGK